MKPVAAGNQYCCNKENEEEKMQKKKEKDTKKREKGTVRKWKHQRTEISLFWKDKHMLNNIFYLTRRNNSWNAAAKILFLIIMKAT